jgi:arginine/serine-rich splicing factor 7
VCRHIELQIPNQNYHHILIRMAKLYVSKVSENVRESDLYDLFGKYGTVNKVDLKKTGIAFVEMDSKEQAEKALRALDACEVKGSRLYVDFAFTQGELKKRGEPAVPGQGRCHRCGLEGHWARDCTTDNRASEAYDRRHISPGYVAFACNHKTSPSQTRHLSIFSSTNGIDDIGFLLCPMINVVHCLTRR